MKQSLSYQSKIIKELEAMPDKPAYLFTEFEDNLIRRFYQLKGAEALIKVMPNKTLEQIRNRASSMGVFRKIKKPTDS